MPEFERAGVSLSYDDVRPAAGADRTLVLVHGFASNKAEGWRRTGWYGALERRGVRAVAIDQRGHGQSAKLHEPDAYRREELMADLLALLDHLELGRVDLFGYSMGSRTALAAAIAAPDRFDHLVLGGVGGRMLDERPPADGNPMAEAMLAEDPESISQPFLKSFRQFADEQGEDRRALAAFTQARNPPFDREAAQALPIPVLVVNGARDQAGDPQALAQVFPAGKSAVVPGCDHFSAIPHALTKAAVFDFLDGLMDDPYGDLR